jgi:hypothetical protein
MTWLLKLLELSVTLSPFYAVQKTSNIVTMPRSPLFRVVIGVVAALLFTVKLATPFLHTHQFEGSSSKIASISSQHCDACEYEATQAIEPGIAIILPATHFAYESKVFETQSGFPNTAHSSSESRGPPSIS